MTQASEQLGNQRKHNACDTRHNGTGSLKDILRSAASNEDVCAPGDARDHQCSADRTEQWIALARSLLDRHLLEMRTLLVGFAFGCGPVVLSNLVLRIH